MKITVSTEVHPMRCLALLFFFALLAVTPSDAQVTVVREGQENPVVTVAKSTLWGGLAGLVLGSAIALVVEDNEDDVVKWFFVGATVGGFGLGIYHVATREGPSSALLQIDREGVVVRAPVVFVRSAGTPQTIRTGVTLLDWRF